jgi:cytochrome P450
VSVTHNPGRAHRQFAFDPFDAATIADPYPSYRTLRDAFPVYHNPQRDLWAISRAEDVNALMRDWERCTSSLGMDLDGTGMMYPEGNFLNYDPPDHDVLRKVVREPFAARRILALEPMVRATVTELIDAFIDTGRADVARELTKPLPFRTVSAILGVPETDTPRTVELIDTMLHREPGQQEPPPAAFAATTELSQYVAWLAQQRRDTPREDAMTQVARGEVDGRPLTDAEILGLTITCYVAGSEPVSNFITTSLDVLARHPDARAELFAGAASADIPATAIEELLRFESPLQNMARTTTVPIELHGTEIPAGARLALLLGSANRDERRWDDADALDLHRPARRHIAFGEGVHYCLGAPLARLQGRVALEEIARRLPEYEITGPVVRLGKVNSRGMESLPIAF